MLAKIFWYLLTCSIYMNVEGLSDCNSKIFCRGKIPEAIQLSDPPIYKHSTDFVEMKLLNSPETIRAEFESIEKSIEKDGSLLKSFATKNFEPDFPEKCSDIENQEMPKFKAKVASNGYRRFVSSITEMWPKLIVQTKHVKAAPALHSLVYLPNCQVKSDEFTATTNYSDNYWVFRGLMANGMTKIAAGIIENYTHLIRTHGFVLHSNRVYSSRKTQLPLLALMVEIYYSETKKKDFVLKNLEAMETEFLWWKKNRYVTRTIKKETYGVFQYNQEGTKPRSEAFREDHELSLIIYGPENKKKFFSSLRAIDETGLGFCSRFKRSEDRTFASINVRDLVPVELNSVLHRYAVLLAKWVRNLKKDIAAANKYEEFAKNMANVLNIALWNENKQMWQDWDVKRKRYRLPFSPTNLMPMFTMSYPDDQTGKYCNHVLKYLQNEELISSDFLPLHWLIPFSKMNTGEVWDFPYGSPPQNLFIIEGLIATYEEKCEDLAMELTKALVKTIYVGYEKKNTLYKQYSAVDLGMGVNERIAPKVSQAGYAWTNGAVLTVFEWFGYLLQPKDYIGFTPSRQFLVPVESKQLKKKKGKVTKSTYDDDYREPSNIAGPSQQPTRQFRGKGSKPFDNEESEPSSYEGSSKNKYLKGRRVKPSTRNKSKQYFYPPSSSEESIRKELERQNSKQSDQFEPPLTEATTEPSPRVKRRRRAAKKADAEKSEPPSNETAQSEQPGKKRAVRKASKKFVEEFEPLPDEIVPEQTSRKRGRKKSSKLSDTEGSEPPSNEVPQAEQPQKMSTKKRKSSKPIRTD